MNTTRQSLQAGIIVAVLCCSLSAASWGDEDAVTIPDQNYTLDADYEPIGMVIGKLRREYDERICVEYIYIDTTMDRITASEAYQELMEAQKQGKLSWRRSELLKMAKKHVENNEGDMNFGWREHIFKGEFTAPTLALLLDQLLEGSPYGWYEENGTYVILPRQGSRLQYPVTIDVENVLLSDVVKMIVSQAPEGIPIRAGASMSIRTTTYSSDVLQHVHEKKEGIRVPRLVMQNAPAMTVLNRAVESSGGQVVWTLTGGRNELITKPIRGVHKQWIEEYLATKASN